MLDRKTSADIYRIEFRADFLKLAIQVNNFIQLTPVIDVILYTLVQKYVKHFQLKAVFVSFDLIYVKFEYVARAKSKSRRIKRKRRFFFCCHTDTELKGNFYRFLVSLQFFGIVEHRHHILKSCVEKVGNPAGI